MPDVGLMFPSEYLSAADLDGREWTLEIGLVEKRELRLENGKQQPKWVLVWKNAKKPLVLNKTNAKTIAAALNERNTDKWPGKRVTVFPTTCKFRKDTVPCIRVRPGGPEAE